MQRINAKFTLRRKIFNFKLNKIFRLYYHIFNPCGVVKIFIGQIHNELLIVRHIFSQIFNCLHHMQVFVVDSEGLIWSKHKQCNLTTFFICFLLFFNSLSNNHQSHCVFSWPILCIFLCQF